MAELTQAIAEHRAGGSMAITIKLSPNGESSFQVSISSKSTVPKPGFGKSFLYHNAQGDLLRDDPNQERLPLRDINQETPAQSESAAS